MHLRGRPYVMLRSPETPCAAPALFTSSCPRAFGCCGACAHCAPSMHARRCFHFCCERRLLNPRHIVVGTVSPPLSIFTTPDAQRSVQVVIQYRVAGREAAEAVGEVERELKHATRLGFNLRLRAVARLPTEVAIRTFETLVQRPKLRRARREFRAFFSHAGWRRTDEASRDNHQRVALLTRTLRAHGVGACWIGCEQLVGGAMHKGDVAEALEHSGAFVCFVDAAYLEAVEGCARPATHMPDMVHPLPPLLVGPA